MVRLPCPAPLPCSTRFGFRLAAMLPTSFDLHSASTGSEGRQRFAPQGPWVVSRGCCVRWCRFRPELSLRALRELSSDNFGEKQKKQ